MKRSTQVALASLAVSAAITATLLATRQPIAPSVPEPVAPAVRVLRVDPGSERMVVHSQGTVLPRTEADLVPEVSGAVLWTSPNLVAGGYFQAGETLLRIDGRDYQNALERARAAVDRAMAVEEFARFDLKRLREMEARNLVSASDIETGIRAARVAEADLASARAAVSQAELDLSRTELRAAFAGLVRSEQVDPGQFVSRGDVIARLYAVDYLEVRLPIADQQLAYLNIPPMQRGELDESLAPEVELSADFAGQHYKWRGRIARTEAEIDMRSRMVNVVARVRAAADDPHYAPPPVGLFVQAEIQGRSAVNVVVVPRSAMRNGNQLLIVDENDRLRLRTVSVARIYGDDAYIDGGLEQGERVCISALQTVVDGMRVEVVMDGVSAAPGAAAAKSGTAI
ncbi:MAG: efflux RND transporter periplasmic adaptor subunit [Gammaproteobacteria bacterium]|nr:efflux RND transporter periplasmic adaptor subunit [Gammaproteobacteria bacterium]MDE0413995.1 efflux RND transporter periplasmic adaptor subunit [Gammaproteobacteria bacterium]